MNATAPFAAENPTTASEPARPGTPIAPSRVEATTLLKVAGRSVPTSDTAQREVRLLVYRSVSATWTLYASLPTSISAGATYTASVRLPYAGTWRLVAQQLDRSAPSTATSDPRDLVVSVPSAISHIRVLAANGPRTPGSRADVLARRYVVAKLMSWGYIARSVEVRLPDGRRTANIVAEKVGASRSVVVIGGHLDSKWPSPGANDNGSGCAATLELARRFATTEATPTIRFVFFAAEEMTGSDPDKHHFGSRQYVASLSRTERARIVGMMSLDMIGVGARVHTRSMGVAPRTLERSLRSRAAALGYTMTYLRDPSRYGWSDHEAFERAGIPVAWIEWRDDPRYHTRRDTVGYVSEWRIRVVERVVESWLRTTGR